MQKIFVNVTPCIYHLKLMLTSNLPEKNILQCESFFLSSIFFSGETFKNWGKVEVQLRRTSFLMSPSLYMYNLFGKIINKSRDIK